MKKIQKNRPGFSIAEVIIAMAVVVLVTATALTTVLYTRKAENRILRDADAIRVAENILECYKATVDEDAFLDALAVNDNSPHRHLVKLCGELCKLNCSLHKFNVSAHSLFHIVNVVRNTRTHLAAALYVGTRQNDSVL